MPPTGCLTVRIISLAVRGDEPDGRRLGGKLVRFTLSHSGELQRDATGKDGANLTMSQPQAAIRCEPIACILTGCPPLLSRESLRNTLAISAALTGFSTACRH